jgi:hypothetical protein
MSMHVPADYTEAELFYHYVGQQMSSHGPDTSLKGLLNGYVEYRRQVGNLRQKLRAAEASSARGESTELDIEQLIAEVTHELAAEGIVD